jgi:uncharacterized protein (TIGR00369 family)
VLLRDGWTGKLNLVNSPLPHSNADRVATALAVPLQHALGARLVDPADARRGVHFPVRELACTPFGTLHGGALVTVLELAGYLAVLAELSDTQHAVTHAMSVQHVAAAREGEDVVVVGRLVRRARSIAFVAAVAYIGDQVIAEAQITKSIIERG